MQTMKPNLLLNQVRQDIVDFLQLHDARDGDKLTKTETLFYSKRDLQIRLYAYLEESCKKGRYDRIYADYVLRRDDVLVNDDLIYPWPEDLTFDLVVRKGEKFVPVQLTYDPNDLCINATRFASRRERFVLPQVCSAAEDFWKSVHQIDMMRYSMITTLNSVGSLLSSRLESAVEGGIALFMSNEYRYWEPDKNLSDIFCDRAIDTRYDLPADAYMLKNVPKDIPLRDSHRLEWNSIVLADETDGHPFQYTLLDIPQSKNDYQN